jgi:hypothetical protein
VLQAGSEFRAGSRAEHRPKISHDGRALHVDIQKFDIIDYFIMEDDFIDDLPPQHLQLLLATLLEVAVLPKKHHERQLSPIDAMSRVLLGNKEVDSPQLFKHASTWLCHTLSCAVFKQLNGSRRKQYESSLRRYDYPDSTSDGFADLLINQHKHEHKNIDILLDLFEAVQSTFPAQPWPGWAKSPRNFDLNIHVQYLRELSREAQLDPEREGGLTQTGAQDGAVQTHEPLSHKLRRVAQLLEGQDVKSTHPHKKKTKLQGTLFEPRDPNIYAHLTKMAESALAWRKVFVTRRGYIGYGPKWLAGGETVMLVCGADVPYAFIPLEVDRRPREQDIRADLGANDEKYYQTKDALQTMGNKSVFMPLDGPLWRGRQQEKLKRLDEERLKLQQKLDRILNSSHQRDAWVLRGEVYIEGIMHGEAVRSDKRERIIIV